jgi:hypothetical protein
MSLQFKLKLKFKYLTLISLLLMFIAELNSQKACMNVTDPHSASDCYSNGDAEYSCCFAIVNLPEETNSTESTNATDSHTSAADTSGSTNATTSDTHSTDTAAGTSAHRRRVLGSTTTADTTHSTTDTAPTMNKCVPIKKKFQFTGSFTTQYELENKQYTTAKISCSSDPQKTCSNGSPHELDDCMYGGSQKTSCCMITDSTGHGNCILSPEKFGELVIYTLFNTTTVCSSVYIDNHSLIPYIFIILILTILN